MFYARFIDTNGQEHNELYFSWDAYHEDTFSPAVEVLDIIDFKITGKTYKERKECARNLAVAYSHAWENWCLSYYELAAVGSFFREAGKKHGLLREFAENAIC